jgi:hypothetical protein
VSTVQDADSRSDDAAPTVRFVIAAAIAVVELVVELVIAPAGEEDLRHSTSRTRDVRSVPTGVRGSRREDVWPTSRSRLAFASAGSFSAATTTPSRRAGSPRADSCECDAAFRAVTDGIRVDLGESHQAASIIAPDPDLRVRPAELTAGAAMTARPPPRAESMTAFCQPRLLLAQEASEFSAVGCAAGRRPPPRLPPTDGEGGDLVLLGGESRTYGYDRTAADSYEPFVAQKLSGASSAVSPCRDLERLAPAVPERVGDCACNLEPADSPPPDHPDEPAAVIGPGTAAQAFR